MALTDEQRTKLEELQKELDEYARNTGKSGVIIDDSAKEDASRVTDRTGMPFDELIELLRESFRRMIDEQTPVK
jgi:hypothetical protein